METPLIRYMELLCQLHDLIAGGKGDSAEADSLRDQMDAPHNEMTDEERHVMEKLSEYLSEMV